MLVVMNAQDQEVPTIPEVPSITEEQEEEKVYKVEIVKNSSFEAANSFGKNEFRVNFFDLLVLPGFHAYYEKIIDENSSYGTGLFINFSDNLSSDIVQRRLRFLLITDFIF